MEAHQCSHLVEKKDGSYDCGKYDEIIAMPEEEWYANPAFGAGCCMSLFNENRERLLRLGREQGDGDGSGVDVAGVHG